jgi:heme-degrading monooxygenase HmoA
MYIRMTFVKLKHGKREAARKLYNDEVISTHIGRKGLRFVHLLESTDNKEEGIAVTAWDTREDAIAYERGGDYEKLIGKFKEMIIGEPLLKSYQITASSEPLLLRIF